MSSHERSLLLALASQTGLLPSEDGDGFELYVGTCVVAYTVVIAVCILVYQLSSQLFSEKSRATPAISRRATCAAGAFACALSVTAVLFGHISGIVPDCNKAFLRLTNGGCLRPDFIALFILGLLPATMSPLWLAPLVDRGMPLLLLFRIGHSLR